MQSTPWRLLARDTSCIISRGTAYALVSCDFLLLAQAFLEATKAGNEHMNAPEALLLARLSVSFESQCWSRATWSKIGNASMDKDWRVFKDYLGFLHVECK